MRAVLSQEASKDSGPKPSNKGCASMTTVKKTPSPREITRTITSDAYYQAVHAVSNMGLFAAGPDSFTIGPGTNEETTIHSNRDGTLDFPPHGGQIRLRHYAAKGDVTVFQTVWQSILSAAYDALSDCVNATFGTESTSHFELGLHKQYETAAKGVRSTLKHGYLHNPSGVGYAALSDFIGRDRISTVLSIAGTKATLKEFNTVIRNMEVFQEAKTTNPNAVLLWFKEHLRYTHYTAFRSADDIISQAKTFFEEALRNVDADRTPGPIWPTMTKLNHEATARYLQHPIHVAQMAMDAHDAGANPSFTAIRVLSNTARAAYGRTSGTLAHAFMRESEHRSLTRRKTQAQLADQYLAIDNPHRLNLPDGQTAAHLESIIKAALEDLMESRNTDAPLLWQEVTGAIPKETLETLESYNKKARKPRARRSRGPSSTYLTTQELDTILDGPANHAVENALVNTLVIKTQYGKSTELWQAGTSHPVLSVWKTTDGTINYQAKEYMVHGPLPDPRDLHEFLPNWTTRGLKTEGATQAVEQYLKDHWQDLTPNPKTKPPTPQRINSHIHRRLHDKSRKPRHTTDEELSEQLTKDIASILDQEVYDLANTVSHCVNIDTYNLVASAKETIRHLIKTNPGATTWVMTFQQPKHAPEHPSEFITTAKNTLIRSGLDPRHWRATATLAPQVVKAINDTESKYHETYQNNHTDHKTFVLNAMAASQTIPSPDTAKTALEILPSLLNHQPQNILSELSLHNARTFLVLLIREGITHCSEEVTSAKDYLQHINRKPARINSTTWRGLCKASNTWHRDLRRTPIIETWNYIIHHQEGFYQAWHTELEQYSHGKYTVTPLSSEYDLYQESLDMEHCVIGYGARCAQGRSRIFSIADTKGDKLATTEIRPHAHTWTPVQTRGKRNHPVSEDIQELAQRVALHYQETCQEEQPSWWVNLHTGEIFQAHPNQEHQDAGI